MATAPVQQGAPASGATSSTAQTAEVWSPLTWTGEQPLPWFITIPIHVVGVLSFIAACVFIWRGDRSGDTHPGSVFSLIGTLLYVFWLAIFYRERNLVAQYRWYWVREHDRTVVSDLGQAPNALEKMEWGLRHVHGDVNQPMQGSLALRIRVAGVLGWHKFVWMCAPGSDDIPPKVHWRVIAFDGTYVTMRDRLGNQIVVTPQLALRVAQYHSIETYWQAHADARMVNVDRERAERIQRMAGAHLRTIGEARDAEHNVQWTRLQTVYDKILTAILHDDDTRASVKAPTIELKSCSGARDGHGIPPIRAWAVAAMHGLLLLAIAAAVYGFVLLSDASGSATIPMDTPAAIGATMLIFFGMVSVLGYIVWFLASFKDRNLKKRDWWHWTCTRCGDVTTATPPGSSTALAEHALRTGTHFIKEQFSGPSRKSVIRTKDAGSTCWFITGTRGARLVLRFGTADDRRIVVLPPYIALHAIQDEDPSAYWLACEEQSRLAQDAQAAANELAEKLRGAQETIRNLLRVDDRAVFAAEMNYVVTLLTAVAGAHAGTQAPATAPALN